MHRQVVAIVIPSAEHPLRAQARRPGTHCYVVTCKADLAGISPGRLLRIIRNHWGIVNKPHHVPDRTMRDGADNTRVVEGARILGMPRNGALRFPMPPESSSSGICSSTDTTSSNTRRS